MIKMPSSTPDPVLLRSFVRSRDQSAFGELVERHSGAVYSTTFASFPTSATDTVSLAEEATQLAFVTLAKKAPSLLKHRSLLGWLILTAKHCACNLERKERKRKQREENYVKGQEEAESSTLPKECTPLILEALHSLKSQEREAVMLKFFQNKTYPEIARILGITADAARMKVKRSLGKLNQTLLRRGYVSSSSALVVVFSSEIIKAVPATLTKTIHAQVGLIPMSQIGALAIMKTKKILTLTALSSLVVVPTVYLKVKESTQREDRQRLEYTYSSNEGYRETQSAATQSERQSAERKTARSKHTKDPVFESIPTRYLLQADAILQFMKLESISSTKSISVSDPSLDKDRNQQEEFSRVLGLRLGLSEQQQMEFTQLLLQNFDERKSYEAQPGPPAHAVYAKIKNKAFPRYHMALEIMKDKGILSAPQEEVREKMSREFREVEEKHFDVYKEGITPARWENNSQIRANLDQMLTPDQREELQAYVEEKQIKQREALVIQRRDIISQQLGLSIEEEQVIEQFLKEQPNASKEAISELLSPELAEIYLGEESSDK